jgi:hypothetical protein
MAASPGLASAAMSSAQRILRVAVPAVAIGFVVAIQRVYFNRGLIPGDSYTYLAAGERLNAGHLLYALSPGDRPVGFEPPFFAVPLLSPPPIAVLFRPLAALPNEIGVYVWWVATIVILAATILVMLRHRPILVGLAVLVLSIPIVYQIGVGNLNGLIVAGVVGAWYLLTRRRDVAAGAVFALMTALKLTPGIFLWWLIAAVLTMIAGSPVVQITWFTILLAALAPVIWPMPVRPHVPESPVANSGVPPISSLVTGRSRQRGNAASSAHAEK